MKKIFNHLLTDILLALVVILTIIIVGRTILAGNNIYNIVKDNISEKVNDKKVEEGVLKNFIEEDAEGISEYINENEFDEEMGNLISAYFKYTSGISKEKPNLENFEKVLKEAISKYEEKTGKQVDEKQVDNAISSFDKVLEESTPINLDKRAKTLLNIILSDTVLGLLMLGIILVCMLLYLNNKNIFAILKSLSIVLIVNALFLFALSYLVNKINKDAILAANTIKFFNKLTTKYAIINLVLAIIFIIILIINNINKKKKDNQKQRIQEIENSSE